MPAEKQSALVGFSIDATVFFFLQPNQISRDVECWHAGRAMTATGVEWGGWHQWRAELSDRTCESSFLKKKKLWADSRDVYVFVLLTHSLYSFLSLVFLFLGAQHLFKSYFKHTNTAPRLCLGAEMKSFVISLLSWDSTCSKDGQICNAKTEQFRPFEPKRNNSSSVTAGWHFTVILISSPSLYLSTSTHGVMWWMGLWG